MTSFADISTESFGELEGEPGELELNIFGCEFLKSNNNYITIHSSLVIPSLLKLLLTCEYRLDGTLDNVDVFNR